MNDHERNYRRVLDALEDGKEVSLRRHCTDNGKGYYALVADIPEEHEYCLYLGPSLNCFGDEV